MPKRIDQAIAALNGLVGDHLARTGNGLATAMGFVRGGGPEPLDEAGVARLLGDDARRVVALVHGLMGDEQVWEMPDGDYGARLAERRGYAPVYLRYNTGLSIADNGAELASSLGRLVAFAPRPVEELLLVGHSMGGLVLRAACHAASVEGSDWLGLVRRAIYLGTPHLGAPLERVGRALAHQIGRVPDPLARLLADVAALRSDGIRDLGDADLRHEDRARRRPSPSLRDPAHPVPLLPSVRHLLVAGALTSDPTMTALFGDAIVPVPSATGARVEGDGAVEAHLVEGIDHMALTRDPRVYEVIERWLGGST